MAGFAIETILNRPPQIAASVGKVVPVVSGTKDSTTEILLHLHGCMCLMHLFPLKECVTTCAY